MDIRHIGMAFILSGGAPLASALDTDAAAIGLVAGDPSAAANNTRLFKQLVSPAAYGGKGSFEGTVRFDRSKVYYFNDVVAFKDNIQVDLQGSTLHFGKLAEDRDRSSGFIFAMRNFSMQNGKIEVDYDGLKIIHAGAAIQLGQRFSNGGIYFPKPFDSLMPVPMGNIHLSNLSITSNNPAGACGVAMFGGLVDVTFDSVQIDGQDRVLCGIYYEFGQAAKPTSTEPFPTSHAHKIRLSDVTVGHLAATGDSIGIGFGGAYDVLMDGITISGAHTGIYSTAGESAYFRPWGDVPATRTLTMKRVTMTGISGTAFNLSGSGRFTGGYLGRFIKNPTAAQQTDLLSYVIEDFSAEGSGKGWGIFTSGASNQITKGNLRGFVRGIVATDDVRNIDIDSVIIQDVRQQGIQLNFGAGIWNPPRPKSGSIRNCTITVNDPRVQAITVNNTSQLDISNNTLNFVGSTKNQAQAIYLGPAARGVKVKRTTIKAK
jgi:hypothetical protein